MAELKELVILRQDECVALKNLLSESAKSLSRKATLMKVILIVLGAIVATSATASLVMEKLKSSVMVKMEVLVAYAIIGVVISVVASLEAVFHYEPDAAQLRSLASLCNSYDKKFMADYTRYKDPRQPEVTIGKLELLIDSQNEALDRINDQTSKLNVDLSKIDVSYRI